MVGLAGFNLDIAGTLTSLCLLSLLNVRCDYGDMRARKTYGNLCLGVVGLTGLDLNIASSLSCLCLLCGDLCFSVVTSFNIAGSLGSLCFLGLQNVSEVLRGMMSELTAIWASV